VKRQKEAPITVILGNPPYNAWQLNENDNNKNRKYPVIDGRVRQTYAKDSKATNKNALSDMYVKFFRWAVDRLNGRDGIVCFVSNNSFVEQIAFDGMRKHLTADFTHLYHLHLEGNVRQNPKLSGTAYNVFGIQVGVGITMAVRRRRHRRCRLSFHRVDKNLRRGQKLAWLAQHGDVRGVKWQQLKPDARDTWLVPQNGGEFGAYISIGSRESRQAHDQKAEAIFATYSGGVKTNRDEVVYDFQYDALAKRVQDFIEAYNGEVDRYKRTGGKASVDDFVRYDRIKWSRDLKKDLQRGNDAHFSENNLRSCLFRPFCRRYLYFDRILNEEVYGMPSVFPTGGISQENLVIAVSDIGYRAGTFSSMVSDRLVDIHLCAALDAHQCFPLYVYNEDGANRRENITDWALKYFREYYRNRRIRKVDVFYYVYGILHHPGYRERYAENLKRELPRVSLAPAFAAFSKAGRELARLHLDYEKLDPWPLEWIESPGVPFSYHVEKMRLNKEKTAVVVNDSLTLAGIPPEAFRYRLGNRSALEWIIDQYRVTGDSGGGIRSDPNRPDDAEYIVRLLGQVVRASVETMRIIAGLPRDFGATQ